MVDENNRREWDERGALLSRQAFIFASAPTTLANQSRSACHPWLQTFLLYSEHGKQSASNPLTVAAPLPGRRQRPH
jgi:hypothetical protein